jgi:5-methylphenazine-1-carboxylate 1-monooxygenase
VTKSRGGTVRPLLDERSGGVFDDIDAVIPPAERDAFMARYKAAAGFAMDTLNNSLPIIISGARVRSE